MSDFEYIKNTYGVSPSVGQVVIMDGQRGTIVSDEGHHIGVNFDSDRAGVISHCHPTWQMTYTTDAAKIRKKTKSQKRYDFFQKYSDLFDDFREFLGWVTQVEKLEEWEIDPGLESTYLVAVAS